MQINQPNDKTDRLHMHLTLRKAFSKTLPVPMLLAIGAGYVTRTFSYGALVFMIMTLLVCCSWVCWLHRKHNWFKTTLLGSLYLIGFVINVKINTPEGFDTDIPMTVIVFVLGFYLSFGILVDLMLWVDRVTRREEAAQSNNGKNV